MQLRHDRLVDNWQRIALGQLHHQLRQNLIAPLTRFVIARVVAELPNLPQCPTFHIAINVGASAAAARYHRSRRCGH
jgi:EAL domain-containing protein (putative c-di-GMP-specific phosphodiesterase class I)